MNGPAFLVQNDHDAMREGNAVFYACMEMNGFITFARTEMKKEHFLNEAHIQKTGTIIVGELLKCLGGAR